MLNQKEIKGRKMPFTVDGMLFLTNRTSITTTENGQTIYQGYAYPGSSETEADWLIQRITIGDDDAVTTLFANGQATFDQVWANRTQLNYL
ncbi:MAG: hypothetical protein HQM04_10255 [Magnetococcales bacterium]|nr:hypothetical protein [Magnetococcales bacterium]MBF0115413.1 hypothetical protein [Magnetococcales bacterium]